MPRLRTDIEVSMMFGVSLKEIRKKLVDFNIFENNNGTITNFAIENGLGVNKKIVGTRIHVYSAITDIGFTYLENKLAHDFEFLSECLLGKFRETKYIFDKLNGGMNDHQDLILYSVTVNDDFEETYDKYDDIHVRFLFYQKLEKDGLLEFARNKYFFKQLEEVVNIMKNKEKLEKELQVKSSSLSRMKI